MVVGELNVVPSQLVAHLQYSIPAICIQFQADREKNSVEAIYTVPAAASFYIYIYIYIYMENPFYT
jgi:hypothetical protein